MGKRAKNSGVALTEYDAALVKGMLARGDRQHDIAAWFGVNSGRIAEIATGHNFEEVIAAGSSLLPPAGPYPKASEAVAAISALATARQALLEAERNLKRRVG